MAVRISRRSRRSSVSFWRFMVIRATGSAAVERIIKMAQATTSSSRVIPARALLPRPARRTLHLPSRYCTRMEASLVTSVRGFCCESCPFTCTMEIDEVPLATPRTMMPSSVPLPCRGVDSLAALLIDPLDDGDLLRAAGKEAAVADLVHGDHRGVVLQQHGDGEEVVDVFHHYGNRRHLARTQRQTARLKARPRHTTGVGPGRGGRGWRGWGRGGRCRLRRRRRYGFTLPANLDVRLGAGAQGAQVGLSDRRLAHDARYENDQHLVLRFIGVLPGEKVAQ